MIDVDQWDLVNRNSERTKGRGDFRNSSRLKVVDIAINAGSVIRGASRQQTLCDCGLIEPADGRGHVLGLRQCNGNRVQPAFEGSNALADAFPRSSQVAASAVMVLDARVSLLFNGHDNATVTDERGTRIVPVINTEDIHFLKINEPRDFPEFGRRQGEPGLEQVRENTDDDQPADER